MKGTHHKVGAVAEPPKPVNHRGWVAWLIACLLIAGLGLMSVTHFMRAAKDARLVVIHEKAAALGILDALPEIEARHVWITENASGSGRNGDIPVHIMFRPQTGDEWRLVGTGTKLGKYPGYLLTASHVFEDLYGQYGCREIGPKELDSKEPITPIVSCDNPGNADDAVLCRIDANSTRFPPICVRVAKSRFRDFIATDVYNCIVWTNKICLNTCAQKSVQGVMFVGVQGGTWYLLFDQEVVPGESGTGASMDGTLATDYLVVVRSTEIKRDLYEKLGPELKKRVKWFEGKKFGFGYIIRLNP